MIFQIFFGKIIVGSKKHKTESKTNPKHSIPIWFPLHLACDQMSPSRARCPPQQFH
jgi:hypothetical protein